MASIDLDSDFGGSDAYAFLTRAAIGFEPLFDVFPDRGEAVMVPVLTTAALLAAYRRSPRHWWEYLPLRENLVTSCRNELSGGRSPRSTRDQ